MITIRDAFVDWEQVDEKPSLGNGVQVYRLSLMAYKVVWNECFAVLDKAEQERARRIRVEQSRDQFVFGRAMLRLLLAGPLGCKPASVVFSYSAHGRPELEGLGLCFNVAHSGDVILVALSRRCEVGVDVEGVDLNLAVSEIAEQALTPAEIAWLSRITTRSEQVLAFYRCWTRKEALLKADGRGLTLPLNDFAVHTTTLDTLGQNYRASICDLSCGAGYVGALALIGEDLEQPPRLLQMSLSAVRSSLMII